MTRVEPASPFGHALVRNPKWYGPGEQDKLEAEFSRVDTLLNLMGEGSVLLESIIHILSEFHDIRNSLKRPTSAPMDEVELFEVKHFLIYLERLAEECGKLPGLEIRPMDAALNLLDPSGRRLPAFSVENAFEPALERVREEKALVENALRQTEKKGRDDLMARRRELVLKEDRLELEARKRLTMALLRDRDTFLSTMEDIGRLDLVLAKAKLARRFCCCRPAITAEARVVAVDMIHPEVADHLKERGGEFTSVSLTLEQGATVITGANMGGKTVSLRSTVLSLLLCQCGFFVFAARADAFARVTAQQYQHGYSHRRFDRRD